MFCPVCGAENQAHTRLCIRCGGPLADKCPHCSASVHSGARFCSNCGKPIDVPGSPAPAGNLTAPSLTQGERRQVTVLFADFAGFTEFAYNRDAEDVRDYMNSLWERMDAIIAAHGGVTEKHIGDAVMAVFGVKHAREEDPAQAVRAALAMQAALGSPTKAPAPGRSGVQRGEQAASASKAEMPGSSSPDSSSPSPVSPAANLQLRIGIHTGMVVLGPLGPAGELTVAGDTVNLASRLEQSAPVGGILISHDTYRHVYGLFELQPQPLLQVKGRPEPAQTYLVPNAKPRTVASQLRDVEGVPTEMVGRKNELKRLQELFDDTLAQQKLRIALVVGEAGIGKSCLRREFMKWMDSLPQMVRLFTGRATPQTPGLHFSLIRDVFFARFDILESDPHNVARQKLISGLLQLAPGFATPHARSDEQAARASGHNQPHSINIALIGQLLGLDFSADTELKSILNDPEEFRHRAFEAVSAFFAQVSSGPPQQHKSQEAEAGTPSRARFLVLEDLHWSDDGSLELLRHLIRSCKDVPLMIVCLARPDLFERHPHWVEKLPLYTRLDLSPLSRNESLTLVKTLLHKLPQLPQALVELIVSGAEGIPFYIEEIVKMLIDQKVIIPATDQAAGQTADPSGQWQVLPERLAAAQVPPTLTGVLQARLDGLNPFERSVLQRASVIGRVFWDDAVQALGVPHDSNLQAPQPPQAPTSSSSAPLEEKPVKRRLLLPPSLLPALDSLCRKELILRLENSSFAGATEYAFKHELLRNVTYESLLKKARREYHGQVADWLIENSRERISEYTGLVAMHLEHARRPAEAADWYARAGQQARAGFAPATAIGHFRKALALSTEAETPQSPLTRLDWLDGLGETLAAQARFAEGFDTYQAMANLASQTGNTVAQARAANGNAYLHERSGDYRASIAAAERAEYLARSAGSPGLLEQIKALHLKGWAFYRLGDATAVLSLADQTLKLCTDVGDRRGLATSLKLYGVAHLQLGHFDEANRNFEQGLPLCEEFGDRRNAAAMWNNLGETARIRGDCLAAVGLYEKALAIARQTGNRGCECIYLNNLSGARLGLKQFAQAETDLREVLAITGERKAHILSETYYFLSEALLGQGRVEESIANAHQALDLSLKSGASLDLGGAYRALGVALAAAEGLGKKSEEGRSPAECFHNAARVFEVMASEGEIARTLLAWAECEARSAESAAETGAEKLKRDAESADHVQKAQRALEIFSRLGMSSEAKRTQDFINAQNGLGTSDTRGTLFTPGCGGELPPQPQTPQ